MKPTTALLPLVLVACASPIATPTDAALDARADVAPDVAPDVAADVTPDVPARIPPLAPAREPVALTEQRWLVARTLGVDPVWDRVERREFTLPAEGTNDGVTWRALTPGASGELGAPPANNFLWAATRLELAAGQYAFARVDRAVAVYTDHAPQPGDVYASGRTRVPLVPQGDGTVVVRGLSGRGAVITQVFRTDDELHLNLDDLTVPDLVAGESRAQWVGVPVLNLTRAPALDVTARVEGSDAFEATAVSVPSLPSGAVTQVAFALRPRRPYPLTMTPQRVALRVESPSLQFSYRREVELAVVAPDRTHRRTFVSRIDSSAQYYGVVPPTNLDAARDYGLVLTLHGAGVEGIGQARAYSPKPDAWIIAPTNRRPFGFDWEVFGRVDALEVLDDATAAARIDPTRVYVTGHSMGGHGTWQLGVLFPGRFATVSPSAGWDSFMSYTGRAAPRGAFARSQASSSSSAYLSNLARRGVYVVHGSADDNVPVREGRTMSMRAREHSSAVTYHEQPGAGHWWDGDLSPGADCVDWPPMFALMSERRLDPWELDFTFTSPSPWVSPRHSFVTVLSASGTDADVRVTSAREGASVTLTTANVRAMEINGNALRDKGITSITIDGTRRDVPAMRFTVGDTTGKTVGRGGPFNEVLERPWCVVYPDDGPAVWRDYASYLVSTWALQGNGAGCALPRRAVTPTVRAARNLVWVGGDRAGAGVPMSVPFAQDDMGVSAGTQRWEAAAALTIFPAGEHLDAWITASPGVEFLLFRVQPFTSSFVLPDWFVWDESGGRAAGFYRPDWRF